MRVLSLRPREILPLVKADYRDGHARVDMRE